MHHTLAYAYTTTNHQVLKDCEQKHNTKQSKHKTLADAISERMRDAVGLVHWENARRIQKRLAINQRKQTFRAIRKAAQRHQSANEQDGAMKAAAKIRSNASSPSANSNGSDDGSTDARRLSSFRSYSSLSSSSSDDQGTVTTKKTNNTSTDSGYRAANEDSTSPSDQAGNEAAKTESGPSFERISDPEGKQASLALSSDSNNSEDGSSREKGCIVFQSRNSSTDG